MIKTRLAEAHRCRHWLEDAYQACFGPSVPVPVRIDCLYLAYINDLAVGWGSYSITADGRGVVMNGCGVLPSHRGQGVQYALLKKRLAHAFHAGRDCAYTYSHVGNIPSNNNLIRAGFRLWRPGQWGEISNPEVGNPWLYWWRPCRGRPRGEA